MYNKYCKYVRKYNKKGGMDLYKVKVEKLIELRSEAGLNRAQLSEKAGLPRNAISRIERGIYKSTHPIRAKAIAVALGCDINDIFDKVT